MQAGVVIGLCPGCMDVGVMQLQLQLAKQQVKRLQRVTKATCLFEVLHVVPALQPSDMESDCLCCVMCKYADQGCTMWGA